MMSGLDLEGEVSASEDEEDAVLVAMLERPNPTYEIISASFELQNASAVNWHSYRKVFIGRSGVPKSIVGVDDDKYVSGER
jgi:hypothetical protein